jgi:isopenicillin-N N-acyltransferase-like protein
MDAGIAKYTSTSSDRTERGTEFGEALRPRVQHTVNFYLRLFGEAGGFTRDDVSDFGAEVRSELASRYPELVEEIDGIARGAATDADLLVAVNARTELLTQSSFSRSRGLEHPRSAGRECSHAVVLPTATADGHTLLGQTWDFHPDQYEARVLWTLPTRAGGQLITFTEAGILAKIGMNSSGVGCLLAFLASEADRRTGGVPAHLTARLVLESATNAAEALRAIYSAPTSGSVALTIGYAGAKNEGFAAACECSAGRVGFKVPDERGVLVRTNHFLALDVGREPAFEPGGWHSTIVRQDFIVRWLRARVGSIRGEHLEEIMTSTFDAPDAICVARHSPSDRWADELETLATVWFDLHARAGTFSNGARSEGRVSVSLGSEG